ncbi:hypothetical protein TeGR_g15259 [Tetraparma gracilis]|uniref:tRNA/rRNA methyltransferase SpoU type domain-containing protein n=1 Tax=Tetraparma gracilis TaxID=2962635 RepID=A0ABQ6MMV0_9STRA|nr:hypothetical protein TeGR_g15259 [Tetraparma gracilis]
MHSAVAILLIMLSLPHSLPLSLHHPLRHSSRLFSSSYTPPPKKLVASLSKLLQRKHRVAANQVLVEGAHSISDITHRYTDPPLHPSIIFAFEDLLSSPPLSAFSSSPPSSPSTTSVYSLPRDDPSSLATIKKLSDTSTPAGAVAVFPLPPAPPPISAGDFLLISDGVSEPGNLGGLARTYLSTGLSGGILALPPSADPLGGKALRASTGALGFAVPTRRLGGMLEFLSLMDEGFGSEWKVAVATMEGGAAGESRPYTDVDWKAVQGVVLGNEAGGVSDDFLARIEAGDERFVPVHVPMDNDVESLNVAVVGALCLMERRRA